MKALIAILVLTVSPLCFSSTTMNLEGTCTGTLKEGTAVAFTYYSNFDGCKKQSRAAIVYSEGGGLAIGVRILKNGKDVYSFGKSKIMFKDFTGESSGTLQTEEGVVIPLQCEMRNYEYATQC